MMSTPKMAKQQTEEQAFREFSQKNHLIDVNAARRSAIVSSKAVPADLVIPVHDALAMLEQLKFAPENPALAVEKAAPEQATKSGVAGSWFGLFGKRTGASKKPAPEEPKKSGPSSSSSSSRSGG